MDFPKKPHHYSDRIGWLRAAVLGANDGIVSTSSLLLGVAATNAPKSGILIAGIAGLAAGAMSMAAGEYVSVQSQADAEQADLERELRELHTNREGELQELTSIYIGRGLDPDLAHRVAEQLTAHDALGAHARDELGLSDVAAARPLQAAATSALSFAVGAALPLVTVVLSPPGLLLPVVGGSSLVFLAGLGALAAHIGGAPVLRAALRVTFWSALAMGITSLVGKFFGPIA
ncbi:MAG TPA: VIT family protein [Planctomycetota bacterium]|nr:VIT family protein [Planctomycetota bacterium]